MDTSTNTGSGYLQVKVSSANGASPEEGALVLIFNYPEEGSDQMSELVAALRTDISGLTETITLPAPPKSLSQTPSEANAVKPYSAYNIEVSKDGFYSVEGVGVPIFDGVTSIQRINLIPQSPFSTYPAEGTQIIEAPGYSALEGQGNGGTAQ